MIIMSPPSQSTLDKYGLTTAEWIEMFAQQGFKCPICGKSPKSGKAVEFNTDHQHVRGYDKLPPEERKKLVRGIVCQWDNRSFLAKGMTLEKAKNLVLYLSK